MKKSKMIGAVILCVIIMSLLFIVISYILDKLCPHYTFSYGDSNVAISVINKERANNYYTFTTNNPQVFEIEHFCGQQIPNYFIKQSEYNYNLKLDKQ